MRGAAWMAIVGLGLWAGCPSEGGGPTGDAGETGATVGDGIEGTGGETSGSATDDTGETSGSATDDTGETSGSDTDDTGGTGGTGATTEGGTTGIVAGEGNVTAVMILQPTAVRRGEPTSIVLDGSGSKTDGAPLTYDWHIGTATLTEGALDDSTLTIEHPAETNVIVALQVTDGAGWSTALATIPINDVPVAHAGSNLLINLGDTALLDGSQSIDPDGDALTYAWSITAQPTSSQPTLIDESGAVAQLLTDQPGIYRVQLVVSDSFGAAPPAEIQVRVLGGTLNPPTVSRL